MRVLAMTTVTLCVALFAAVTSAQTVSPDKATRDAAHELVSLSITDETFNALADQAVDTIAQLWWLTAGEPTKADMAKRGVSMSAEDEARMKATMRVVAGRVWLQLFPKSDLRELVVSVWTQHLTAEEMNEIIRFYKTPVGSKAAGLAGKMIVESRKVNREIYETKSATFWERAKAELMKEVQGMR